MTSYRQQINQAIKAQLTGKTIAGSTIFTSLDRPLDPEADLPAIMVYTMASRRGPENYNDAVMTRLVSIGIEAAVVAAPGAELAAAEALADSIEEAMEADRSLGRLVNDCQWQQTISDVTSHGRVCMGVCMLQYQVEILTNQRPDNAFEFNDDGFTAPPTQVYTVPNVVPQPDGSIPDDCVCGPDGCDIPAWKGELP